jgi:protein-disulfide isomerase
MQRRPGLMPKKNAFNTMRLWITLMLVSALLIPTVAESQRAQPLNLIGGKLDAPIRLEVYSDFQCSACALFFLEVVIPAVREYGSSGEICVLYNEFPLTGHKYSHKAARYSLAAQHIGRKQWLAVMQALYRRQPIWSQDGDIDKALNGAISSGDLAQIKEKANEPAIHDAVNREVELGVKREISSTPTVFVTVNNKTQKIERVLPYEVWKDFIDDKLK